VTWASSDLTVSTVSNAEDDRGLATTVAVGSTTITATRGQERLDDLHRLCADLVARGVPVVPRSP
jgi:uncharacterized protein YjdB